jgi:hypothetical protein
LILSISLLISAAPLSAPPTSTGNFSRAQCLQRHPLPRWRADEQTNGEANERLRPRAAADVRTQ